MDDHGAVRYLFRFQQRADEHRDVVAVDISDIFKSELVNQRAGQNVLYAGIFVEFRANPYAGVGGDNIYTAVAERPLPADSQPDMTTRGVVGPNYAPAWKLDTYLVPTAGEDRNE